jgi:hypothetical protein
VLCNSFVFLSSLYFDHIVSFHAVGVDFERFWKLLLDGSKFGITKDNLGGNIAVVLEENNKVLTCADVGKAIDASGSNSLKKSLSKSAAFIQGTPDIVCSDITDAYKGSLEAAKK